MFEHTAPDRPAWRVWAGRVGISLLLALAAANASPAAAQGSFFTVTPCRAVDTRLPAGIFGGPPLAAGVTRVFSLAGRCGVSTGAAAVAVNVTVVGASAAGHLTFFPASAIKPLVSTINYAAFQTRANNAILIVGAGGAIGVSAGQALGGVHLILDVVGYFADPAIDQTMVAPPAFTPGPGAYAATQMVALATSTPGAQIRYTTDSSDPTSSTGTLYSGAIALHSTAALKAIAVAPGLADSAVSTGLFRIGTQPVLLIANLTPQGAALSGGSGTATLVVAGDGTSAVLRRSYSNLTTPVNGEHIHGPADPGASGGILFDIDSATPRDDGSYLWVFAPVGTNSVDQIITAILTGRTYLNIHTSRYPAGEIRGQFHLASGSMTFTPPPAPPTLPGGPPTARDAARFLQQATYGPAAAEIAALQSSSFDAWLTQQFQQPLTAHVAYLDAAAGAGEELSSNQMMESFWQQAATGPDALRQRVALALSEIFVISDQSSALGNSPYALASYMDLLEKDAFGNYRQLLDDVTLSPAMGLYLNMLGNDKEDPSTGQNPNENYAREILQLFSIGLLKTFPDGTLQLDANGLPIPTYDQSAVMGLARVFTGWSFGGSDTTDPDLFYYANENDLLPMAAWPSHHSTAAKTLLDGAVTAPNQTAQQDLKTALDDIFNHPNVGPFISRLLIQRLVTSNPSPAYVYRVAQVFANDGHGVRGNLQAVVRAILLDYEARAEAVTGDQGYGHLREPIVRLGALLRTFHATAPSGKFRVWYVEDPTYGLGQNPLRSPTVFNFFKPDYSLPGAVAGSGLVSPEFQILTETTAIGGANFFTDFLYGGFTDGDGDVDLLTVDLSSQAAITDPAQLVDSLNLLLMANSMSPEMRTVLIQALSDPALADPNDRATAAVRLIVTSPEYMIQR